MWDGPSKVASWRKMVWLQVQRDIPWITVSCGLFVCLFVCFYPWCMFRWLFSTMTTSSLPHFSSVPRKPNKNNLEKYVTIIMLFLVVKVCFQWPIEDTFWMPTKFICLSLGVPPVLFLQMIPDSYNNILFIKGRISEDLGSLGFWWKQLKEVTCIKRRVRSSWVQILCDPPLEPLSTCQQGSG